MDKGRGIRGLAGRTRAFVQARPRTQKVTALGAVALLATAPFGGLREVEPSPPTSVQVGQTFRLGPFEVEVRKARTTTDLSGVVPGGEPEPGRQFLLLDLEVTNAGDRMEYAHVLRRALELPDAAIIDDPATGFDDPTTYITADSSRLTELQAGLSYPVTVIYQQERGWRASELRIDVTGLEWVDEEADFLSLDPFRWRETSWRPPAYAIEVPVTELAPQPYVPSDPSTWDDPPAPDPIRAIP